MLQKSVWLRWLFIIGSLFISFLILWNTYQFFNQLKENERSKMHLWADAQKEFINSTDTENNGIISETILNILQSNKTTPMIVYSYHDNSYDVRNLTVNETDSILLRKKYEALTKQFAQEYKPIEVYYKEELLQTIYYGNSPIINKIKYYPMLLILIILLFFTALYFFYKTSKSSEQNKLWAGMAKETAHQIGTPLSSLVGWAEIFKAEQVNPAYISEMEKDINRLHTITDRFSKIGSVPNLEHANLIEETKQSFLYLKSRSSKLITFSLEVPDDPIYVNLNKQLYSWTIENLVKNGIDAMKGKGEIHIEITSNSKYGIVRVSDTGKGIPKRDFKKIFNPGFTTKKRGWGLGLSLTRRIIQEYHKGKIQVLKSTIDKGTTMEILILKA